jgi:prephenate dehydrogenase
VSIPKPRITIVGLGRIGCSMGLRLQEMEVASEVMGHDVDPTQSNRAKRIGAVTKTYFNLISACEESDLVLLAIPLAGIRSTFEAIGPYLREGCVVMDTATLKKPVLRWADELLPAGVHFVGGNPILRGGTDDTGLDEASSELFVDGLFCLTPAPDAEPAAVKLAADLVAVLGARPLFLDAAEHDGLCSAVEHLPSMAGVALLDLVVSQPTWQEMRKLAGDAFAAATTLPTDDEVAYRTLIEHNRDNLVRWLDGFVDRLQRLRRLLDEEDLSSLDEIYRTAAERRQAWQAARAKGDWGDQSGTELPERPSVLGSLFGTFWQRNRGK